MSYKLWLLTLLYIVAMLVVGLKPFFGVVFSYTTAIVAFLTITFLVITFLLTENKGSKLRTIVRYIVVVIVSTIAFFFIDFEIRTHTVTTEVGEIVAEVVEAVE